MPLFFKRSCTLSWILLTPFITVSWIFLLLNHKYFILVIISAVVVTSCKASWSFKTFQTFSIGFMSGEFPDQYKTDIFSDSRYFFIACSRWQCAPSCINWNLSVLRYHLRNWWRSSFRSTCRYILQNHGSVHKIQISEEIMDHIITCVGCLTLWLTQSGKYLSPVDDEQMCSGRC